MFDKTSRMKKRKHARNKVLDIERVNVEDPVAFWDYIKHLSPRKKTSTTWKTFDNNKVLITDKNLVL